MIWAFWGAAALAAVGGLMPIVFAGPSSRLSGILVPFFIAAAAFGGCALVQNQGRTATAIIFFVAGLAIVFGLLAMFSLPLRLAVLGTCPAAPAPCTSGLPRPLTDAENTAMGAAAALGIVAIFVGFFGLTLLYRRTRVSASPPPTRRIPPMPPRASTPAAAAPASTETKAAAIDEKPAEAAEEVEQPEELPPHQEPELPELPAPESTPPTT